MRGRQHRVAAVNGTASVVLHEILELRHAQARLLRHRQIRYLRQKSIRHPVKRAALGRKFERWDRMQHRNSSTVVFRYEIFYKARNGYKVSRKKKKKWRLLIFCEKVELDALREIFPKAGMDTNINTYLHIFDVCPFG